MPYQQHTRGLLEYSWQGPHAKGIPTDIVFYLHDRTFPMLIGESRDFCLICVMYDGMEMYNNPLSFNLDNRV